MLVMFHVQYIVGVYDIYIIIYTCIYIYYVAMVTTGFFNFCTNTCTCTCMYMWIPPCQVPIPTRFLFIMLGPKGNRDRYHEVGRSIATLMSDEVHVHMYMHIHIHVHTCTMYMYIHVQCTCTCISHAVAYNRVHRHLIMVHVYIVLQ